jgi:hypothetical protein
LTSQLPPIAKHQGTLTFCAIETKESRKAIAPPGLVFKGAKFRNGSEAAKVDPLERMAALSQKAELNQACPSVLICSQFGQKRKSFKAVKRQFPDRRN